MSRDWLAQAEEFGFYLKWGIPNVLLTSSVLRNASQIKFLSRRGVGAIISLTAEIDAEAYQAIQELRIQRVCASDSPGVEFVDQLIAVYCFFRRQVATGQLVLIHNSLLDDERVAKFTTRLGSLHEAETHNQEIIRATRTGDWRDPTITPPDERSPQKLRTLLEARLRRELGMPELTQPPAIAEQPK